MLWPCPYVVMQSVGVLMVVWWRDGGSWADPLSAVLQTRDTRHPAHMGPAAHQ